MRGEFSDTNSEAQDEFYRTDEKEKSTARNLSNGKLLNYHRVQRRQACTPRQSCNEITCQDTQAGTRPFVQEPHDQESNYPKRTRRREVKQIRARSSALTPPTPCQEKQRRQDPAMEHTESKFRWGSLARCGPDEEAALGCARSPSTAGSESVGRPGGEVEAREVGRGGRRRPRRQGA